MKRIIPILISLVMLLSGCASQPDYSKSEYTGNWQAVKFVSDDIDVSSEMKEADAQNSELSQRLIKAGILLPNGKINLAGMSNSNDLSTTTLVLKKDGVSVMTVSGRKTTGYWEETKDGIVIIGRTRKYKAKKNKDGTITVKRYGATITYQKL